MTVIIGVWLGAAVLAAVLRAAYSVLQKQLTDEFGSLELAFLSTLLGLPFLLPAVLLMTEGIPSVPSLPVLGATLFSGVANIVALIVVIHALRLDDLSVVEPLKRLTPVMVAVLEPVVLGAALGPGSMIGAALAAGGALLVLGTPALFRRSSELLTRRGPQLAVLAALLYTLTSLADRFATTRLSPFIYTVLIYVIMAAGLGLLQWRRDGMPGRAVFRHPRLLALGAVMAAGSVFIFLAFSLASAAQVTTVLQGTILLGVVLGGYVFDEQHLIPRLVGGAIIIAGIALAV